jgi:prephenate dehydratase
MPTPHYYLGPAHTFGHQASKVFRSDNESTFVDIKTHADIFEKVSKEGGRGTLALTNRLMNYVPGILPLFVPYLLEGKPLEALVSKEVWLPVNFCMAVHPDSKVENIEDVTSFCSFGPPFEQCRKFLAANKLSHTHVASSTADAAVQVATEKVPLGVGALTTKVAAEAHNLRIVADKIADHEKNSTLLVEIDSDFIPEEGDGLVSYLMFCLPDKPGSLYYFLEPFAKCGIGTSAVISSYLDSWGHPGEDYFFVRIDMGVSDRKGSELLEIIRPHVSRALFMGCCKKHHFRQNGA